MQTEIGIDCTLFMYQMYVYLERIVCLAGTSQACLHFFVFILCVLPSYVIVMINKFWNIDSDANSVWCVWSTYQVRGHPISRRKCQNVGSITGSIEYLEICSNIGACFFYVHQKNIAHFKNYQIFQRNKRHYNVWICKLMWCGDFFTQSIK